MPPLHFFSAAKIRGTVLCVMTQRTVPLILAAEKKCRGGIATSAHADVIRLTYSGMALFFLSSTLLSRPNCLAWRFWKNFSATCGNRA